MTAAMVRSDKTHSEELAKLAASSAEQQEYIASIEGELLSASTEVEARQAELQQLQAKHEALQETCENQVTALGNAATTAQEKNIELLAEVERLTKIVNDVEELKR